MDRPVQLFKGVMFTFLCFPSVFDLEILKLKTLNVGFVNYSVNSSLQRFEIFFPSLLALEKLRNMGFFDLKKSNPISNSRLLLLEDLNIIRYYGSFAYDFITWFRCCYNFSKVKILVEFLRKSCLLTLSRKHNKRKSWSHFVYTSDLVLLKGLFFYESFFPSKSILLKMERKFFNLKEYFIFNEAFFIG